MNKIALWLCVPALIVSNACFAQAPAPAETPANPSAPGVTVVHHHEHHVEIHRAMRKLRGAKADLEKAVHDYGGHKAAAIADIDQALAELQTALTYVDSH